MIHMYFATVEFFTKYMNKKISFSEFYDYYKIIVDI
jgi:hypothetical protein